MIISSFNPETADYEKTYLSDAIAAGTTSLAVKNNNKFGANDRVMIGEMGQEKTEIVTASGITGGTVITTGATVFDHEAESPIYDLRFDQFRIYRSTTGIDGTYGLLATVDIDVDNSELQTLYDDTVGIASYYYKVTAYHSLSTLESNLEDTDPIKGEGWLRKQVGRVIDEILHEVSDENEVNMTRNELLGYFNDVNDDLLTNASKPYDFLRTRTTFTRTANATTLDFPTDSDGNSTMWKFDRMDYNFSDTTTDPDTDTMTTIMVLPEEEFRNRYSNLEITSTNVTDDPPTAIALDTAVSRFRYWPASENTIANAFYMYYWKFFTEINSEGDELETPTPKIYKLYAKGIYYRKRAVTEPRYHAISDRYFADYQIEKARYKQVDRKDKGTPRGFRPRAAAVRYRR